MAANSYGNFNPGGIDPFPIEGTLASAATTSPAEAQLMLNAYHQQNLASQGLYTSELDQQHEQARQQIASQMADRRIKAITEAGKTPGMLGLLASTPELAGLDQSYLTGLNNQQLAGQAIERTLKGAQAGQALTTSGAQPNQAQFGGLTGIPNLNVGTPEAERVANINAAARIAAAGVGAGVNKDATTDLYGPNGELLTSTKVTHGDRQPAVRGSSSTSSTGMTGGPNPLLGGIDTSDLNTQGAGSVSRGTNLPVAKQDTAEPTKTQAAPPPAAGHVTARNLQQAKVSSPQAYADIMQAARVNNGQVKVGPNGGLVGASGVEH